MIVIPAGIRQYLIFICISWVASEIEHFSYVYWPFVHNLLKIVDLASPLIVVYDFLLRICICMNIYVYIHVHTYICMYAHIYFKYQSSVLLTTIFSHSVCCVHSINCFLCCVEALSFHEDLSVNR